jgi:hypothetical protein
MAEATLMAAVGKREQEEGAGGGSRRREQEEGGRRGREGSIGGGESGYGCDDDADDGREHMSHQPAAVRRSQEGHRQAASVRY